MDEAYDAFRMLVLRAEQDEPVNKQEFLDGILAYRRVARHTALQRVVQEIGERVFGLEAIDKNK
jgi:hypothetical protein